MAEEKVYTSKEALAKGYLQDKKVYLKPIPKRGSKMITDPAHTGYFMWEKAKKSFCLPQDKHGILVNPFKNEEEANFLSKLLDVDLNPRRKEDNYWHTFEVSITKTAMFMHQGEEYDLSDPMDNLRYRILKLQFEVAPSWEARYEHPAYRFVLVEEDYEEKSENEEMEIMEEIYTFWGSIKSSPKKMKEFLGVYFMHKRINKQVGEEATKEFLTSEIQKIIKNDKETVFELIKDEDANIKYFIYRAVQTGVVRKKGVGTYNIVGTDEKDLSFQDLIKEIKYLKEMTDPIYLKMEAQINTKK